MNWKNTVFWKVFGAAWEYFKEFYPPKDDDDYWDAVCDSAGKLFREFEGGEGSELAKGLTLTLIDELERVYRARSREE